MVGCDALLFYQSNLLCLELLPYCVVADAWNKSGPSCGLPSQDLKTPSSDGMQAQAALFDGSVVAFDIPPPSFSLLF